MTNTEQPSLDDALKCVDGDWQWLCDQLEQWPTRVHPERTTCESYLRESAAKIIRAALFTAPVPSLEGEEMVERLRAAIEELRSAEYLTGLENERDLETPEAEEANKRALTAARAVEQCLAALSSIPTPVDGESFQSRVQPWLMACFGEMIAGDREERNHRFLEEALELVQALDCTASEAHQLIDYVYGRPKGEASQEVGGVMATLAALCLANGLDMHEAAETELARIWTKVEQIRAKQAAKPKHSPLPGVPVDHNFTFQEPVGGEYRCHSCKRVWPGPEPEQCPECQCRSFSLLTPQGGYDARTIEACVEAASGVLPKERWSCSDDASGTALTLARQRAYIRDAIRALPHSQRSETTDQPQQPLTGSDVEEGITQADREAAADLIETYWSGADASMMRLAKSYRDGHTQGVWARAFSRHRIESLRREALEPFANALEEWGDDPDHQNGRSLWEHPLSMCKAGEGELSTRSKQMKAYIGSKIIQAEPQDKDGSPGYRVVYPDNYVSWSPKAVFEEAYRPISSGEFDLINPPEYAAEDQQEAR